MSCGLAADEMEGLEKVWKTTELKGKGRKEGKETGKEGWQWFGKHPPANTHPAFKSHIRIHTPKHTLKAEQLEKNETELQSKIVILSPFSPLLTFQYINYSPVKGNLKGYCGYGPCSRLSHWSSAWYWRDGATAGKLLVCVFVHSVKRDLNCCLLFFSKIDRLTELQAENVKAGQELEEQIAVADELLLHLKTAINNIAEKHLEPSHLLEKNLINIQL